MRATHSEALFYLRQPHPKTSASGDAPPPSHDPEVARRHELALSGLSYPRAAAALLDERDPKPAERALLRSWEDDRRRYIRTMREKISDAIKAGTLQLARALGLSKVVTDSLGQPPALYVCHRDLSKRRRGHKNAPRR